LYSWNFNPTKSLNCFKPAVTDIVIVFKIAGNRYKVEDNIILVTADRK
jgi:hypothetical protein